MRIFRGQYDGNVTTKQNAFVSNMLKFPEISKVLMYQYKQYTFTYLTEALGRVNGSETDDKKLIGDEQIQWFLMGRLNEPSEVVSHTGTGVGGGLITVELADNYRNKYDRIRLRGGQNLIVVAEPTPSGGAGNWNYLCKLETNDATETVIAADLAAGLLVNTVGSAFPEGSRRGYQNKKYPDMYTNWLTIMRKECGITGSAFTDITWIENNGHRLWYFTEQEHTQKEFMYQMELARWYGHTTMDGATNTSLITDDEGNPIITGDGLIGQIEDGNIDSYAVLTENLLIDFMTYLATESNFAEDNNWIVFTGMAGMKAFHQAMADHVIVNGNFLYDMGSGREVEVGVNYRTYNAVGQKITLVHNPIFDDRNLFSNIDPETNLPFESSRMVFLNFAVEQGVSNIEIYNKGAEGFNRSFIMKYIPGMMDPFNPGSMTASNANDGFSFEILTHSGVVVRDPKSCGMLVKTAV